MIKRIELRNFKRFREQNIELRARTLSLIVGGNNSGKSSILHALAVWEYCKTVLYFEKSTRALYVGFNGEGYGVNIDDFTPINIPSLKYLWTNLSPSSGYNLTIKCFWDLEGGEERFLTIGLALTQERLFIKALQSSVQPGEKIPNVAYLPPFAGITDKEQYHHPAFRNKLVGQGLAGAVLRNTIIDLYRTSQRTRESLRNERGRIPSRELDRFRHEDPYERLNAVLFSTFRGILQPSDFNDELHTNVKVDFAKGEFHNQRFRRFSNYNKRDIMVEGSGFLQWLSVYTFALNPRIDVLLLDEPDAHLHTSLQGNLMEKLSEISGDLGKQILIATHSTDVVKRLTHEVILHVASSSIGYLTNNHQKTRVLSGLGTEYFPRIEAIQRCRRILFVENESDANILKIWCETLGLAWPDNLVVWPFANNHKERKQLFLHLKDEIPGIKCISLEDRDNNLYENTNDRLTEPHPDWVQGQSEFRERRWRRWELENYLISPPGISRACNCTEEEVRQFLRDHCGIIVNENYTQSDRDVPIAPLFDEGKAIIEAVCVHWRINKVDIVRAMQRDEIFADPITFIGEIITFCSTP